MVFRSNHALNALALAGRVTTGSRSAASAVKASAVWRDAAATGTDGCAAIAAINAQLLIKIRMRMSHPRKL